MSNSENDLHEKTVTILNTENENKTKSILYFIDHDKGV